MLTFSLDGLAQDKLAEWYKEHDPVCRIQYAGAAGGKLTYTFTPNNLGLVTKVICACGEEVDVSDYDW